MSEFNKISPICKVHHINYSFGWVLLLPFFAIGVFEHGRGHDKNGLWSPRLAIRFVKYADFHNCTHSGVY